MNRPLTAELIRTRTKTDNLVYLKRFTLCNHDLDDVRILRQMPNIEILSLSVNKINSLKEFANCTRLQELYVRKNNIADLSEVFYLADLKDLRVLWLCENPCAENNKYYREFVINALPNLESLDQVNITAEERAAAARIDFDVQEPKQRVQTEYDSPQKRKTTQGDYESNKPKQNGNGNGKYSSPGDNYNSSHYEDASEYYSQQGDYYRDDRDNYRPSTSPTKVSTGNKRDSPNVQARVSANSAQLKNENVIAAILMLMKDLDDSGLRILRKGIDRKLGL